MKRLLLIVPLLCLATGFDEVAFIAAIEDQPVAAGGCATTDTLLPHDLLLEGWQGAGEENTWVDVGTTINDDFDSTALTSGKPVGACNEALNIIASAAAAYKQWSNAVAIVPGTTAYDVVFHVRVTAVDTGDLWRIFTVSSGSDPTTGVAYSVGIQNSAGTISVFGDGSVDSAAETLTLDTWHKIKIHSGTATTDSTFQVNDGTAHPFTRSTQNAQFFSIGATRDIAAGESGTLQFDVIAINTP